MSGTFGGEGSKKRVAHKGASSNTELIKNLAAKKELMGDISRMGANTSQSNVRKPCSPPKKNYYSMFSQPMPMQHSTVKRRKINDSSDDEDKSIKSQPAAAVRKNYSTTFTGNSFSAAVSKMGGKLDTRKAAIQSESEEEDSEPGWLSKKQGAHLHGSRTVSQKKAKLPPPPKTNFLVKRRAVLSSSASEASFSGNSDEDEEEVQDFFESEKLQGKGALNGRKRESLPKKTNKKPEGRGAKILSDEDEREEDTKTPSSSSSEEDSAQENKKSLKQLAQKAKKITARQKRKRRKSDAVDQSVEILESEEEQQNNSDDEDEREVSFDDSDESEGKQRQTSRSLKKQKEIEEKCIEFINEASAEELKSTGKFNDKLVKFLLDKRPFESFGILRSIIGQAPRGVPQLETYLEYLENRGVLDQVLDDCKQHVNQIKDELTKLELHPYQQVGLQWLIMMNKLSLNAILGDEMGLGKTIQIIAFLAWMKDQPKIKGPHLIVVPSSTIENWMNEMQKWCPSLKVLTYYGSMEQRGLLRQKASTRNVDVVLTTYNMVCSKAEDRSFFKRFSLNYVIYDEGHMLRSCNTLRYQNLMRIQGQRKILLTGTPLQNNLVELISLLFFTMTKMFTKYCRDINMLLQMFVRKGKMLDNKKASKYGKGAKAKEADDPGHTNGIEDGPLYERHKIAQAKSILEPFILRRLKSNVLMSLPRKHENIVMCPISETQYELYNYVMDDLRDQKAGGHGVNFVSLLMQMRQTANHPLLYRKNFHDSKLVEMAKLLCVKERHYRDKNPDHVAEDLAYETDIVINSLCRKFKCMQPYQLDKELSLDSGKCSQLDAMLPGIIEKEEKVLIFSQFTTLLDILELYMDCRGYKFFRLDGSTPVMERQEMINQFNQDRSIPVFLLSTKAGGLGINLTAANHIIIHDIDINPYNDKQAEDRCHRMGQTREVHVTRLVSKDTIEESILALAQKKLELEKDVTTSSSSQANPLVTFLMINDWIRRWWKTCFRKH
uniref:Uncharacterized protein n=1 Tax=Ditylenchus dipsaci TaxID=166011 RepID=A0A915EP89_9BILA